MRACDKSKAERKYRTIIEIRANTAINNTMGSMLLIIAVIRNWSLFNHAKFADLIAEFICTNGESHQI